MTTVDETDTPAYAQDILSQLSQVREQELEREDGTPVIRFKLSPAVRTPVSIDLSQIPDGERIVLRPDHTMQQSNNPKRGVEIKGLRAECEVDLHQRALGPLAISDCKGTVRLTVTDVGNNKPVEVNIAASQGPVSFGNGTFKLTVEDDASPQIVVGDETKVIASNDLSSVQVVGDCTFEFAGNNMTIEDLQITCPEVRIVKGKGHLSVGRVSSDVAGTTRTLRLASEADNETPALKVRSISDIDFQPDGQQAGLTINGKAERLSVDQGTSLTIRALSDIETLEARAESVGLAANNASIRDISGSWSVSNLEGCQVRGGSGGFVIRSVTRSSSSPKPFEGAVLINFDLPDPQTSRGILSDLNEAYQVVPRTDNVPGSDKVYKKRRWWLKKHRPDIFKHLSRDAEYLSELTRLAREKKAPGAIRTKLAWVAYRLHHLNSESKWERLALMCYRALGYGERPGPAFATWLVLAFVASLVVLAGRPPDISFAGVGFVWETYVNQALGPLGSLLDTGTPDAKWLEYIMRPLVAIPLVTGAIALRNYVKQPR